MGKEPRTIYIDEAGRLPTGRLEDLRHIHDETGSPVCLIGELGLAAQARARSRIDDRIPSEFCISFKPTSPQDVILYALEAANLQLTSGASQVVHRLSKGNFRRAHNLIFSLERMAKAAQTSKVDETMARRLADGKGGRKCGK